MRRAVQVCVILIGGCTSSEETWIKPGGSQTQLERDHAFCRSQAAFLPQRSTPVVGRTYSSTTTLYGDTAYTTVRENPNIGSGLKQLGDSLANLAARENFINDCLIAQGWSPKKPVSLSGTPPRPIQTYSPTPSATVEMSPIEPRSVSIKHDVDLRDQADATGRPVLRVSAGEQVTTISESKYWYLVKTSSGKTGFAAKDWIVE